MFAQGGVNFRVLAQQPVDDVVARDRRRSVARECL
jgi:hypothetical protein